MFHGLNLLADHQKCPIALQQCCFATNLYSIFHSGQNQIQCSYLQSFCLTGQLGYLKAVVKLKTVKVCKSSTYDFSLQLKDASKALFVLICTAARKCFLLKKSKVGAIMHFYSIHTCYQETWTGSSRSTVISCCRLGRHDR